MLNIGTFKGIIRVITAHFNFGTAHGVFNYNSLLQNLFLIDSNKETIKANSFLGLVICLKQKYFKFINKILKKLYDWQNKFELMINYIHNEKKLIRFRYIT